MSEQYLRGKKVNEVTVTKRNAQHEAWLVISTQSRSVFFNHSFTAHETTEDLFVAETEDTLQITPCKNERATQAKNHSYIQPTFIEHLLSLGTVPSPRNPELTET